MDFPLTDDQRQLVDALQRALERDYGFEQRKAFLKDARGFAPQGWSMLAELGVLAAGVDPDCGGFGFGAQTLFPVAQALGAALVLEPWLPTLAAAHALRAQRSVPAVAGLLKAIAEGGTRVAIADREPGNGYAAQSIRTRAMRSAGGWTLEGDKHAVIGAPSAQRLLVPARNDQGLALFSVAADAAGVALHGYRQFDGVAAADVALRGVAVGNDDLIAAPGSGDAALERLRDSAAALQCAEAVGLMQAACELTLDYLKTRKQFGVPLGSFQALQHRLVAAYMATEQARSIALLACATVDDDGADPAARGRAVSAAKISIGDACHQVSQETVQLHGGMGLTEEMKISHAFRRLTVARHEWGSVEWHLDRFAMLDEAR